ncbi:von Willebrand factor type A [Pirellula staleyi DSM 6068]|uniref:von Willebrand factor type A n=1 Tax=Pirellula staleyi (strain ATCC 27377 / DSM 6068 / ICPB 4128) TaxID=530564 RepID=D2R3H7_PIRSD|nr:VWA domain-containing protein [Pirellula staleyi]ADB15208.1 von Willebrand factor type A [Pirellula staleyi DSM 6068]
MSLASQNRSGRRLPLPGHPVARRGNIIVFTAVLMVVMLGMIAFAVDVGYMYTMQTQLQRSVDAAALAGAGSLVEGTDIAQAKATEYLVRNPVGSSMTFVNEEEVPAKIAQFVAEHGDDFEVEAGEWNASTRSFETTNTLPSTLSVSMEYPTMPTFFGKILGKDSFSIRASSVAMYQPRDIMVVLDFSGSMNDDSTFEAFGKLGRSWVESNLQQCWADIGNPTYGSLTFEPKWANCKGAVPTDGSKPQIYVEYRNTSVYVTSTLNLENVVLQFSGGTRQTFSGLSAKTGTFQGSSTNSGKQITKVWVKSGNNLSGEGTNYGEPFDFSSSNMNNMVKKAFGLNSVSYPYNGSWDAYIDYCEQSSNSNKNAGYRYKYGYLNLMNYWLESRRSYAQTPVLWKTHAQPVRALKDSLAIFMDFITEVEVQDRVGLAVYNAPNGEGMVEVPLTLEVEQVATIANQRQAGHYHEYTNIGGGLNAARLHLDQHGRPNAFKMIVLITDGQANWRNGSYSIANAENYLISEANLCAHDSRKYPVVTLSLGTNADTDIMEQVATITNSTHFNVPGGSTIEQYHDQLSETFRKIAKARPLKLVK